MAIKTLDQKTFMILRFFLPKANVKLLKEAIKKCFAFRKTGVPPSFLRALKELDTSTEKKLLTACESRKQKFGFESRPH